MRTTILADDGLFLELRGLAHRRGKSVTEVVREALERYVRAARKSTPLSFTAIGARSSGRSIARRTDQIVRRTVKRRGGL